MDDCVTVLVVGIEAVVTNGCVIRVGNVCVELWVAVLDDDDGVPVLDVGDNVDDEELSIVGVVNELPNVITFAVELLRIGDV